MSAGNEYEFRVIALNKGGESEPSPVSNTILAKIRFIKPKINRDTFPSEKTVLATQVLKIETELVAEPAPTISWYFPDGKCVTEGGRGSIGKNTFSSKGGVSSLSLRSVLHHLIKWVLTF